LQQHAGTSETVGKPTRAEDTGNSSDVSNSRGANNSRDGRNIVMETPGKKWTSTAIGTLATAGTAGTASTAITSTTESQKK
jgi:hypothetical protein